METEDNNDLHRIYNNDIIDYMHNSAECYQYDNMQANFYVTPDSKLPSLQSSYTYQGFPVRNIRRSFDNQGAWLVELKAEKKKELHKPSPYRRVRTKPAKEFSGYYIVKHCYAEEPKDVCILNVSGQDLIPADDEDFSLFENVVHIDASDNHLNVETFRSFSRLENLELQVNHVSLIHVTHWDFPALRKLDLSYNNLDEASLLSLGKLRHVAELFLRGCGLKSLPAELARTHNVFESDSDDQKNKAEIKSRFPSLVHFDLSENELTEISTFASLAGLRKLKFLSLSCNKIMGVPQLRLMASHRHFSISTFEGPDSEDRLKEVTTPQTIHNSNSHSPEHVIMMSGSHVVSKVEVGPRKDEKANGRTTPQTIHYNFYNNGSSEHLTVTNDVHHVVSEVELVPKEEAKGGISTLNPSSTNAIESVEHTASEKEKCNRTESDVQDSDLQYDNQDGSSLKVSRLFDDIEKKLSLIGSDIEDVDETTNDLMNIDFGQELTISSLHKPDDGDDLTADGAISENIDDILNDAKRITDEDNMVDEQLRQPFPCLETLDLSYNHIKDEESLLALSSWSLLQDVKLWGNPLMRSHRGVPPVLLHHLKTMCGINIHRKEPSRERKSHLKESRHFTAPKQVRRVRDDLPPIKRNNMLAIENMILQAIESKSNTCTNTQDYDNGCDAVQKEEETGNVAPNKNAEGGGTFFLTQVNETEVTIDDVSIADDTDKWRRKETQSKNSNDHCQQLQRIDTSDYNSMLCINDEDAKWANDLYIPETLHGSLVALKTMLGSELVFNEGHYNRNKQHPKQKQGNKVNTKNRIEADNFSIKETSCQENLGNVLNENATRELRERFPQAKKLVNRVQKKYDEVRMKSLNPISETHNELKKISTRADQPSQDLLLSRIKHGKIGDHHAIPRRKNIPRLKVHCPRYEDVLKETKVENGDLF